MGRKSREYEIYVYIQLTHLAVQQKLTHCNTKVKINFKKAYSSVDSRTRLSLGAVDAEFVFRLVPKKASSIMYPYRNICISELNCSPSKAAIRLQEQRLDRTSSIK